MKNGILENQETESQQPVYNTIAAMHLRSEQVHEILNRKSGFLEKWALGLFLIILLIIFIMAAFINYPDIIEAQAVLSATRAPKEIVIRQEGRLEKLFAESGKMVRRNEILGWMESMADHREVLQLSSIIDSSMVLLRNNRFENAIKGFREQYDNLGELQAPFREFLLALQQFDDYMVNGFYASKVTMLKADIVSLDTTRSMMLQQAELVGEDLQLAKESFLMNEELFDRKMMAREEYRSEKSRFVQKKMAIPQLKTALTSHDVLKRGKLMEVTLMEHDFKKQKALFLQAIQALKNAIDEWKQKYVIVAPVGGEVILNVPLQENRFLMREKVIGYIDPGDSRYFAEIMLPQDNFGKIDTGLQVQLRFSAYPYQEVGYVRGTINYVSKVATDSGFVATVRLDDGLLTSNNIPLAYKEGLQAKAIVITRNQRLLNRLINKFIRI